MITIHSYFVIHLTKSKDLHNILKLIQKKKFVLDKCCLHDDIDVALNMILHDKSMLRIMKQRV